MPDESSASDQQKTSDPEEGGASVQDRKKPGEPRYIQPFDPEELRRNHCGENEETNRRRKAIHEPGQRTIAHTAQR
jgi:hypothetical protein